MQPTAISRQPSAWIVALLALAMPVFAQEKDDVMFKMMKDEMDRSIRRLKMEPAAPPYYVEYTVRESTRFNTGATFGALTGKGTGKNRRLSVDVRVGDYSLDSSNFSGGGWFFFGGGRGGRLTVDDDYDALRHALWLSTDSAYKEAVESLEKKKAFLQEKNVKERPDDFSKEEKVEHVAAIPPLEVDGDAWAERSRKLSAIFREFPLVQSSMVSFSAEVEVRWFLNSEGTRVRDAKREAGLFVMAGAQSEDGMKFGDGLVFAAPTAGQLPPQEEMEKAVRAMAERLSALAKAPLAEEYRGPILFEGEAAGEFFQQILAPSLGDVDEPLGEGDRKHPLREKLGLRVMPKFMSVIDDPLAKEFGGKALLGGYDVDDDGVKSQKVALIEKGMLKTFCMSRIPSRKIAKSNGHSRGGDGATSRLFIESGNQLSLEDLRKRAFEIGKEEGLTHIYICRKLGNSLTNMFGGGGFWWGGGDVSLQAPVALYKVSVEDGKEELVRGATFGGLTMRTLRDIDATGTDVEAHLSASRGDFANYVVTGSILLTELEINKPKTEHEKPPTSKNPFFEK